MEGKGIGRLFSEVLQANRTGLADLCVEPTWQFWYFDLGVSKNMGKPTKSSILIGFSIINHPFWRFPPYFLETPNIHLCSFNFAWDSRSWYRGMLSLLVSFSRRAKHPNIYGSVVPRWKLTSFWRPHWKEGEEVNKWESYCISTFNLLVCYFHCYLHTSNIYNVCAFCMSFTLSRRMYIQHLWVFN